MTELLLAAAAELTAVVVASEEECVGDLTTEAAGHMYELDQPDHRWPGNGQPLALHHRSIRLHDLRLAVDHEPQRPAHGHHGERLE